MLSKTTALPFAAKRIIISIYLGNTLFKVSCPPDAIIVNMSTCLSQTDKLIIEKEVDDENFLHNIYRKAAEDLNLSVLDYIPEKYKECIEALIKIKPSNEPYLYSKSMKYYKFIYEKKDKSGTIKFINKDYEFQMGLNVIEKFNVTPECTADVLYFSDEENIHKHIEYGNALFEVSCPDDATIVSFNDKYKTDKLILERRMDRDFTMEVYLKSCEVPARFMFIPNEYRTQALCMAAIEASIFNLKYVPEELKSFELCAAAVKLNRCALQFIPSKYHPELDKYYKA